MPFGIRPSNVRVCHFTTRAMAHLRGRKLPQTQTCRNLNSANLSCNFYCSMDSQDWIKLDLHIHTLDDPKDKLDYLARELLARAGRLGFGVLAITLHDAGAIAFHDRTAPVLYPGRFDRKKVDRRDRLLRCH